MNTDTRPVARLSWTLYVDCPQCKKTFDVVDVDAQNDYTIAMKVFNNKWDDVSGCEIACPKCEHEFHIGHITY